MNNFIELKNLSKTFIGKKNVKVLKKINQKFKLGKIYSLMGPSGSGKSTLLNLLSLIDRPSSGEIIINNKSTKYNNISKNDQLRADKIGIIYQQNNLLPDFNALENVYLARLAIDNNKIRAISDATKIIKSGLSNSTGWNLGKGPRSIHLFEPLISIPNTRVKKRRITEI